ncbi:TetR/AcrR family transcriptional regulator [Furfurilactobacillus curtus]|uniref:TetR/AcrR family transcriptional regulator n=1 Tax=Furfurilactobacillus curtus TaxID=1746200 RepID=UPI0038B31C6A
MKKKSQKKYEAILDATAQLILSKDVGDVSTTAIAQAVGIPQSSIYTYFDNRAALLAALFLREIKALYQADYDVALNQPIASLLQHYLTNLFKFALEHPDSMTVIEKLKSEMWIDVKTVAQVEEWVSQTPIQQLLAANLHNGTFRSVDISLVRNLLFSTIKIHADNILNGVYTQNERPFSEVCELLIAALMK